jgi:hypothetical protein
MRASMSNTGCLALLWTWCLNVDSFFFVVVVVVVVGRVVAVAAAALVIVVLVVVAMEIAKGIIIIIIIIKDPTTGIRRIIISREAAWFGLCGTYPTIRKKKSRERERDVCR